MIKFISTEIEAQFNNALLDARVKMMTLLAAAYVYQKWGEVLYITSIYRPQDTKSVHGYWRAVDADNDAGLDDKEKQEVCDYLNKMFCYDPTRPDKVVCLYHEVKNRGGKHLHIQVHNNTTLRGL